MTHILFTLVVAVITLSCTGAPPLRTVAEQSGGKSSIPKETFLTAGDIFFEQSYNPDADALQRYGMFLESKDVPFEGCVMYLEGFGDSMQNHYPLFNKLRRNGYRVISFDYLGQGGSTGSLNQMSMGLIVEQAKRLWDNYSKTKDPNFNRSCEGSKKRVLAWSTGGLAAYQLAKEGWADLYVLINPALAPRWCVGETMNACLDNIGRSDVVTFRTLTRNKFDAYTNPHLEKVRPTSPKQVPLFTASLVTTAYSARGWKIAPSEKMLVLMSGPFDAYVDTEEVTRVLDHSGGWYRLISYEEAYHELDNELPEVAEDVHRRIVDFLKEN